MTSLVSRVKPDEKKEAYARLAGKGGAACSLAVAKKQAQAAASVVVKAPSAVPAGKPKEVDRPTEFRRFYDRGDLPIQVAFVGAHRKTQWKAEFDRIDYHHYLPIFFDGVRDSKEPYKFLARQGTYDLLARGGKRIYPVIPQLIIPIKRMYCAVL